jgi:(1->4)-alpha-D-glucan 1-alpha-D-glucosylmutase
VREARLRTNWTVPRSSYEKNVSEYVARALGSAEFLAALRRLDSLVGTAGAQNGLIETVLKLTLPGVPDIYQGAEFWEQSMVDPDNRRPVDFLARQNAPDAETSLLDLTHSWRNGRVKQQVIARLLRLRADQPALFSLGSYDAIDVEAPLLAFERRHGDARLYVAVRLRPWTPGSWDRQQLPQLATGLHDLFDSSERVGDQRKIASDLPFAVFHS